MGCFCLYYNVWVLNFHFCCCDVYGDGTGFIWSNDKHTILEHNSRDTTVSRAACSIHMSPQASNCSRRIAYCVLKRLFVSIETFSISVRMIHHMCSWSEDWFLGSASTDVLCFLLWGDCYVFGRKEGMMTSLQWGRRWLKSGLFMMCFRNKLMMLPLWL